MTDNIFTAMVAGFWLFLTGFYFGSGEYLQAFLIAFAFLGGVSASACNDSVRRLMNSRLF
jgi:hypothetical protein